MWYSFVTISALSLALATAQVSADDDNARIIGGTDAAPGEYPYFVQGPGCSGALIAPDIVMFAAHCGDLFLNQQLNVGGYLVDSDAAGAQPRFCDTWVFDSRFGTGCPSGKKSDINYDFALCKLDKPITDLENPKNIGVTINLDDAVPEVGDDLLVMGFGNTKKGLLGLLFPVFKPLIQEVAVPYVSNEECNEQSRYNGDITEIMLCAGFTDVGGKDACQGDSGGPIVLRTTDSSNNVVDEIVGITSWGIGCADAKYPGVYSRVSQGADWIIDKTCNELNGDADFCPSPPQPEPACSDELVVTVKTDSAASQTSWKLFDSNGNVIKSRKFMVNDNVYEHAPICLEPGCYVFELRAGSSSNAGFVGYKGELNGEEVFLGSDDTFFSASVCVDGVGGPEPVCVDSSPQCSQLEAVNNKQFACNTEREEGKIFNLCNATCGEVGVGPCA